MGVLAFLGNDSFIYGKLKSFCEIQLGTTDWSSRLEQRERPEKDRLIAYVV